MSSLIERKALVLEAISSSSNGSNGSKVSSTQPSRLQTLYSELRTDKASLTELIECLETLTSSQSNAFWKRTNDLANDLISSVGLSEGCDLADRFPEEDESARSLPDALLTLLKISSLICAVLDTSKSRPVAMRETALTLHDILTTLNSESPQEEALQSSISKVCELYWLSKEADAEMFVTQLIPYLLLSAIAEDSNDTFVKRLASIRNAFLLLDFDDESIESIRGLLLRCFVHPRFLKCAEGRRFLSFMYACHKDIHTMSLGVMKPQVAVGAVAGAYGDVLLRAWRDLESEPELRMSVEEVVQTLAHDAFHAVDKRYFDGLREVLKAFHNSKRIKDVDSMLLRIYGPIMWRSLRCANPMVRVQSATLFFDAFPIQDGKYTGAATSENENLLQRQFDLLKTLLEDEDHRVRAVAASGACRVLKDFWEAIPSAVMHQILSFIAGKLGSDCSSALVRLAVVHGLCDLLDNPLSHPALKSILPVISFLINDTSDRVRAGFVKILCKVKTIRGFHFYDIVPIEMIIARFTADADRLAIRDAMTELLLNSYYPQEKDLIAPVPSIAAEQTKRCVTFIAQSEAAAIAFYSSFYKHASVGSAVKMAVLLINAIEEAVKNDGLVSCLSTHTDVEIVAEKNSSRSKQSNKLVERAKRRRAENVASANTVSMPDHLLRGVLKVIAALVSSVSSKITQTSHSASRDMLLQYFSLSKMLDLIPLVVGRMDVSNFMSATMNATYLSNILDSVVAVSEPKPSKQIDLERKSLCVLLLAILGNIINTLKTAEQPVECASMFSRNCTSIAAKLGCDDFLVVLLKGYARSVRANGLASATFTSSEGVTMDASLSSLLIGSILDADSEAGLGLRDRVLQKAEFCDAICCLFESAKAELINCAGEFDAPEITESAISFVRLWAVFASVTHVDVATTTAIKRPTELHEVSCWVLGPLLGSLISLLTGSSGDIKQNRSAVHILMRTTTSLFMVLSDLLACNAAINTLTDMISQWLDGVLQANINAANSIVLLPMLTVISRYCGLLMSLCVDVKSNGAASPHARSRTCDQAWKACASFMLNVHSRLRHLERSDDAVNAAINESSTSITSLFQFVLSRERLSVLRAEFFDLVVHSILSSAPRGTSSDSKSFQGDLILELATSRPKYSEAIASAIRSRRLGENERPKNNGIDISEDALTALVEALQTKATMSS